MTEDRRAKILDKVSKLLAHAEGTDNDDERDAFIAKADALMVGYAIEEWELENAGKKEKAKPTHVKYRDVIPGDSPIREELVSLTTTTARHARCEIVFHGTNVAKKYAVGVDVSYVGFKEDIEYARMLLTTLRLQMVGDLTPEADPHAPYEENLIRLKEAGLKWVQVHEKLATAGFEPFASETHTYDHAVRLSREYGQACERRGRQRMQVQPITYKKNFAAGFVEEIRRRLREIEDRRRRHERERETTDGTSTALVLRDRSELVEELKEDLFPDLTSVRRSRSKYHGGARSAGRAAGRKADLGQKRVGARKTLPGGGS